MSNTKDLNGSSGGCEVGLGMVETSWEYAQWTPIFIPNYYHDFYGHETNVYLTGGSMNVVGPYGAQPLPPQENHIYYHNLQLHALALAQAQAQEQQLRDQIIAKAKNRRRRENSTESDSAYESASTSPNLSPSHSQSHEAPSKIGGKPWSLLRAHQCNHNNMD